MSDTNVGIGTFTQTHAAPPKEGKRPPLYFAFEYMEHDLSGLLNHPRVKFTRTQIQCYMRQLLCGVAFMHRNKIIHRDIKASNLLLNNQGMLKVADFGLSRFWNEVNAKAGRYTNKVVTLWYRPPELLMGSTSYDFSVDIWSIGCIFAELLLGKPILQGKTEIEQVSAVMILVYCETQQCSDVVACVRVFASCNLCLDCVACRRRRHGRAFSSSRAQRTLSWTRNTSVDFATDSKSECCVYCC